MNLGVLQACIRPGGHTGQLYGLDDTILGGASFRGKQVGGKTAAARLEDALV